MRFILIFISFALINVSFNNIVKKPIVKKETIHSDFFSTDTLYLEMSQTAVIQLKRNFSSILVLELNGEQVSVNLVTQYDSTVLDLNNNQDIETPNGFWIPKQGSDKIKISSEQGGIFLVQYFYAIDIDLPLMAKYKKSSPCEKPNYLPAEYWRAGLPDPIPNRNATKVNHVIVHHSAGNNNDTNYVNIVRNIYLLHTQSNGWDDIGYNFLIAPNGLVFGGRDPLGVADIDNIQGAHFCRKNSGTMGICLLGNYNLIPPSREMISKLEDVITWKLNKEKLLTDQTFNHPNTNNDPLGTIAMHQDGCNTLCPGDYVKNIFTEIKDSVKLKLSLCDPLVSVGPAVELKKQFYKIYPNPSQGRFFVLLDKKEELETYTITNQLGEIVEVGQLAKNGLVNSNLPSGTYFLHISKKGYAPIIHKIVIVKQ
jgi:hypothetical protein